MRAAMRIAIVRQRYNPFGGAERFVARALEALAGQGAQVTVVAREWESEARGAVLKVDPFHAGRLWRDWGFARAVCARLATERSISCSRTSGWPAATYTARATASIASGSRTARAARARSRGSRRASARTTATCSRRSGDSSPARGSAR